MSCCFQAFQRLDERERELRQERESRRRLLVAIHELEHSMDGGAGVDGCQAWPCKAVREGTL